MFAVISRRFSLCSVALALALAANACTATTAHEPGTQPNAAAIAKQDGAKAQWGQLGWTDYEFDFEASGFSPRAHVHITVTGGHVSKVALLAGDTSLQALGLYQTVDALFAQIARALDDVSGDGRLVSATYDALLGYPTQASFANASESWSFTVSNLTRVATASNGAEQAKWAALGWKHYKFDYATSGFSPTERVQITITDGQFTSATSLSGDHTLQSSYPTIDALFLEIANAANPSQGQFPATASYDPTNGYPIEAHFRNASENWAFAVSNVTRLTP